MALGTVGIPSEFVCNLGAGRDKLPVLLELLDEVQHHQLALREWVSVHICLYTGMGVRLSSVYNKEVK